MPTDDGEEPGVVEAALAQQGAITVWQAVVRRSEFLQRRNATGLLIGRVGGPVEPPQLEVPALSGAEPKTPADAAPAPTAAATAQPPTPGNPKREPTSPTPDVAHAEATAPAAAPPGATIDRPPLVWVYDDTQGHGALAARVRFPDTPLAVGTRVALTGSWTTDHARRWYWQATEVKVLPATSDPSVLVTKVAPDIAPAPAGMKLVTAPIPRTARPMALAKDFDIVYFQVLTLPQKPYDGWVIATELGDPPVAILRLPGEEPSYGGQDLRSPDERWQLKRGVTYWLQIGKLRRRDPKLPATVRALTAPVLAPEGAKPKPAMAPAQPASPASAMPGL